MGAPALRSTVPACSAHGGDFHLSQLSYKGLKQDRPGVPGSISLLTQERAGPVWPGLDLVWSVCQLDFFS